MDGVSVPCVAGVSVVGVIMPCVAGVSVAGVVDGVGK